MNCPKCKEQIGTVELRHNTEVFTYRLRACLCGHTYKTFEITEAEYEELADLRAFFRKLAAFQQFQNRPGKFADV